MIPTGTVADPTPCADCGRPAAGPPGPPDGWQLEDGRTVCDACCVADTRRLVQALITTTTDTPMSNLTRHEIPSDMRSKVQAVADALGKTCYVALMQDSSLVVTENQDRIEGARRFWVFDPTTTTDTP